MFTPSRCRNNEISDYDCQPYQYIRFPPTEIPSGLLELSKQYLTKHSSLLGGPSVNYIMCTLLTTIRRVPSVHHYLRPYVAFTLRHIVTECDMILEIFLSSWKGLKKSLKFNLQNMFCISDKRARKARKCKFWLNSEVFFLFT